MFKTELATIERLEMRKSDIDKVKKAFKVNNSAEAIQKALDVATGKIDLEGLFERYRGTRIKRSMLKKLIDTNRNLAGRKL